MLINHRNLGESRHGCGVPCKNSVCGPLAGHAEFAQVIGSGHLPQLEVPEQVNAILRNFMARLYQATCRAQGIHLARLLVKMQNPGA